MQKLDWYSQPTGMGTFTSEGTEKLLGTPGVENLELLVRESAQNSWDASNDGSIPQFGIDYRVLTDEQRDLLGDRVFSNGRQYTFLPMSLMKRELDVLEIWDRGTTGLNGPVRADLTVPEGVPTNFIDLIYMIGSSNKDQAAGGNYGFGKSSVFKSSEAKAIVYWTVCYNEFGSMEHRLIASGVSKEFDIDGRSYVGRHWWGKQVEDSETGEKRLEPLIGREAQELGEALFSRAFRSGETGTSILIVDPDEQAMIGNPVEDELISETSLSNDKEFVIGMVGKRLTDVVLKHLWPKLVGMNDNRKMQIFTNGVEITEHMAKNYPYVGSYVACLEAVRNVHETSETAFSNPNVEVFEIIVGRKREVVGHVAMTTNINVASTADYEITELQGTDIPKDSVALMRDGAELIVKYISDLQDHPKEMLYWTGVFKPCPEFDSDFAAAEPSSHDDWIVGSLQGPAKMRVNVSLQRIREAVLKYLGSNEPVKVPSGVGSVSALALELGRLVAFTGGGSPVGSPGNNTAHQSGASGTESGNQRRSAKRQLGGERFDRQVQVVDISLESTTGRRNTHSVEIEFSGDWSNQRKFSVKPKVRIEGNAKAAGRDDHFEFVWPAGILEQSVQPDGTSILSMESDFDEINFDISSPGHFSFDLELEPK